MGTLHLARAGGKLECGAPRARLIEPAEPDRCVRPSIQRRLSGRFTCAPVRPRAADHPLFPLLSARRLLSLVFLFRFYSCLSLESAEIINGGRMRLNGDALGTLEALGDHRIDF